VLTNIYNILDTVASIMVDIVNFTCITTKSKNRMLLHHQILDQI